MPEIWVTDGVGTAYLEDPSQAAVDEGLYLAGCGFGCSPCFRTYKRIDLTLELKSLIFVLVDNTLSSICFSVEGILP